MTVHLYGLFNLLRLESFDPFILILCRLFNNNTAYIN